MEIGELLQKYRLEQGKTQKAWAGKVISPSFYSKVEKGLNRISAEDLLQLLEANQIPLWEFFSHLEGEAGRQNKWEKDLRARLMQAYYHGSQADFQELFQEVQASNFPDKEAFSSHKTLFHHIFISPVQMVLYKNLHYSSNLFYSHRKAMSILFSYFSVFFITFYCILFHRITLLRKFPGYYSLVRLIFP